MYAHTLIQLKLPQIDSHVINYKQSIYKSQSRGRRFKSRSSNVFFVYQHLSIKVLDFNFKNLDKKLKQFQILSHNISAMGKTFQ